MHWRCFNCGSRYVERAAVCTTCLESGTIMNAGVRSPALIDAQPEVTSAEALARASFTLVTSDAYPWRLGAGSLVLATGSSGSGKSSGMTCAANGIDGPVVYVSAEEAPGPSLQARLRRCKVRRADFTIIGRASVDQIVDVVRRKHAVALVIDSLQIAAFSASDLRHLLIVLGPTLRVVFCVAQVNKEGRIEGRERVVHEADVIIRFDAMRWTVVKSRYEPVGASGSVFPGEEQDASA